VSPEPAIVVDDVMKRFRIYAERNQSLKATLMRGRRAAFEEFLALDGVSFAVMPGQTVGFVGENGSGKSTLLKCIARILRPDRGAIKVNGKLSALLELGAGFHPELSGRENVYLNASILGMSKREVRSKFDEIVEFAGLERFIDTPVKNYSSGMYVRLGFSIAINVEPDVLLVDEVLAVGDEAFQTRCAEKFSELRAEEKTIVIVSHGMASVRTMCDQVLWLQHGRIRARGDAGEVIDAYVGEAHEGRGGEAGAGARWGSGEAVIERAELLGPAGLPTARMRTGDSVTFRLHWRARERVPKPVFGVAIHTLSGIHVTGPNTREAGYVVDAIEGAGTLDLRVDRCLLLPGTYDVTVSLVDHAALHVFDFQQRVLRFDVEPGVPHETFGGIVSLGGTWSVAGATTVPNASGTPGCDNAAP